MIAWCEDMDAEGRCKVGKQQDVSSEPVLQQVIVAVDGGTAVGAAVHGHHVGLRGGRCTEDTLGRVSHNGEEENLQKLRWSPSGAGRCLKTMMTCAALR